MALLGICCGIQGLGALHSMNGREQRFPFHPVQVCLVRLERILEYW